MYSKFGNWLGWLLLLGLSGFALRHRSTRPQIEHQNEPRVRLLLALIAWLIYWLIPSDLVAIWASYLALLSAIFALRDLTSALISSTLLLTLLLPITLYQVDTPSLFYKVWFSPLIPLSFLYPDLNRTKGAAINRRKEHRHQGFLILSGLSAVLGNGAFQVMHGLLSVFHGLSKSQIARELRGVGPAITLATLWLILGLLLRLSNGTGIDYLSTAISWIWAPFLCLVFIQLSSRQVSFYLKGLAIGLLTSAVLGLIVTLINPSPSHPLIEPLVSLGSLHQAMQPGQPDRFAAGGFFFHRLKYAHLSLLLLPVLFVLRRRLAYFGLAIVLIALTQLATWAAVSLVCVSIIFVTLNMAPSHRLLPHGDPSGRNGSYVFMSINMVERRLSPGVLHSRLANLWQSRRLRSS